MFAFGKNWKRFLNTIDENRIRIAEQSLLENLGMNNLKGKRFLDVGSGSGLFSLAARRLGATVHSFDVDPESVACTQELKNRFFPNDPNWTIEQGSILNQAYVNKLGKWDIVYSWGVLHHTGQMWKAMEHAIALVHDNGILFLSIYNDQGWISKVWKKIKKMYNSTPHWMQPLILASLGGILFIKRTLKGILRPHEPLSSYKKTGLRGMSCWYDIIDWIGGYPFEVAKPDEVISFLEKENFETLKTTLVKKGSACNEYVFKKKT